ncbi:MAG: RsmE family RNA methyltransferase [Verrucomicrobiota bacterium]
MARFYAPDLKHVSSIEGPEAFHAFAVLRLKIGDFCTLFDGLGTEQKARILNIDKDSFEYEPIITQASPKPPCSLHLSQAIPKGKAMDLILQKTTEVGVSSIYPLLSNRSVIELAVNKQKPKTEKWVQTSVEACKQCGQNWLPQIHPYSDIETYLGVTSSLKGLKLIASLQPDAKSLTKVISQAKSEGLIKDIYYLVGPEGDFTPSEMGEARSCGYIPVSLGPNILRSETAAIFLTSILFYELNFA